LATRAGTLVAALAVVSVANSAPPRAEPAESIRQVDPQARLRQIPRVPAELRPALIALRRGDKTQANRLVWKHVDSLRKWLSKAVVKGRTTRDDVVGLLGPHLQDLDRPERDAVVTQQYFLGSDTASQAICGFCPHVFVDDGRWRLEGKLLAGCIGAEQEGTDTILLPRLVQRDGRVQVKVSNLAPEIEFLDQVQLGSVPLQEGEQLDVGHDGRPFAWRPERELNVAFEPVAGLSAEYPVELPRRSANGVVVLELRNTSAFETAMREFIFGKRPGPASVDIRIRFAGGAAIRINPVGTKFLRRIVVPVPAGAGQITLRVHPEMWLVRRMWVGTGRSVDSAMRWQSPNTARGPLPDAATLISSVDQRRLVLEPMQQVELGFLSPGSNPEPTRLGYVLRITGYYEFQRRPGIRSR